MAQPCSALHSATANWPSTDSARAGRMRTLLPTYTSISFAAAFALDMKLTPSQSYFISQRNHVADEGRVAKGVN
jgi:hypothetical protein